MVRTRAKKAKGDEAFTKRKQKVGRKKLAPVTATRAEVHARTLRLSTPAALTRAPHAPSPLPAASPRTARKEEGSAKSGAALVSHSFTELLAGTRHYKASHRASAFAGLARLLEAATCDAAVPPSGFLVLPSSTHFAANNSNNNSNNNNTTTTTGNATGQVSPLERLRGFTAALEAMTDTTEEVRQGALRVVRALLHLAGPDMAHTSADSGEEDEESDEDGGCGASETRGHEDAADVHEVGEDEISSSRDDAVAGRDGTQMDRAKAGMQTVQICLTHAMKSVRLCGVALLALLLRHCSHAVIRRAARHIARLSHFVPPTMNTNNNEEEKGEEKAGAGLSGHTNDDSDDYDDEEVWMMAMVRRVSQLVLRDKAHMDTLPALLEAFLTADPTPSSCNTKRNTRRCVWRRPALVAALLQELLPQWANAWKEWMELQLGLLRQEDRLAMAVSLARSVATILTFLRRQQQQQQQSQSQQYSHASRTSSANASRATLPKAVQQQIRDLFIRRVPVTMAEILRESNSNSNSNNKHNHSNTSNSARMSLALALARVAVPLATSEDGWRVLQQYFTLVFPGENAEGASGSNSAGVKNGEEQRGDKKHNNNNNTNTNNMNGATMALLSSVRVMSEALRLYPCSVRRPSNSSSNSNGCAGYAEMAEKLLRFCPRLVQAVVRHMDRLAQRITNKSTADGRQATGSTSAAAAAALDAMVYDLLREVGVVLRCAANYPLPAARATMQDALGQALRRCLDLVPRLLFALRLQKHTVQQKEKKMSNSTATDNAEDVQETVCEVSGLLLQRPALVDRIVRRYLRVLWFVVSSGHPLCTREMRDGLRPALLALFGVRMGDAVMEGVLARCTGATVTLARDVLFYLDVHTSAQMKVQGESAAAEETTTTRTDCSAEDMQCVLTLLTYDVCN